MLQRCIGRREFLSGLAGATLVAPGIGPVRAQTGASVRVAIAYEHPGRPIAPDFIGLSYESAILSPGDYFAPDNAPMLGLLRTLGETGVLRIGGNTSERAVWNPGAPPAPGTIPITPAAIDRLAATLRLAGWRLVYGLNLARGTPQAAADEAFHVSRALGPLLLAFQIGNEPDGFGRWTGVRPKGYDAAAFLAEWRLFHAAIRARVPNAVFAGPDVAGATDWVPAFAAAAPAGLVLLTRHYYADGPAGAPHVSLAKLLQSSEQIAPILQRLAGASRTYQLPYRLAETNSIFNEGQPGVSDTLGAALWGLELMFACAAAGCAGINFHAGDHNLRPGLNKAYTPIARGADGRLRAAPLYYAMLMFAQAARGSLVPARVESRPAELKAFAVRAPDGSLRVCLINTHSGGAVRVAVDPGRRFAGVSVLRLAGPAIDATDGVTLGGAPVDASGRWAPAHYETAERAAGDIVVDVAAASAALLSLRA
jgi:hypothetical protein